MNAIVILSEKDVLFANKLAKKYFSDFYMDLLTKVINDLDEV